MGIGGLGLGIRLLVLELLRGLKRLLRKLRLLGRLIQGLRGGRLVLNVSDCPLGHAEAGSWQLSEWTWSRVGLEDSQLDKPIGTATSYMTAEDTELPSGRRLTF